MGFHFPYIRTWTNFWILGMAYAFFWWSLFIMYCICYQFNRIRVYYIRKKRIIDNKEEYDNVDVSLPGSQLWRRLDRVVRIPYVTEMISIKHILGVTAFTLINLYFTIFAYPYEPAPYLPSVVDRRAAFTGMVDWGLVFFFAQRNSFIPKMSGLTFEELIPFHRMVARIGFLNFIPHLVYRLWEGYLHKYSVWDAFFWDFEYTTGSIATFAYIIMFGTSLEYIRRNYFEVFYYSHVLFLIIAIIFTCLHYPTCFAFYIPAVLLWLADRVVRTYQSWIIKSSFVHVDEVAPQTATQEGIVRILFESKLLQNFKPGQYVFAAMVLNGRKLWEYANWHPFTISEVFRVNQSTVNTEERVIGTVDESTKLISQQTPCYSSIQNDGLSDSLRRRRPVSFAADQNTKTVASIHIKALGTKTRDLLEASKTKSDIEVYIDGMYGPHLPYQDYSVLALFAAGIGATPAMSIIQDVVDKRSSGVRTMVTNHIYLSWAIRVTDEIDPFMDMFKYWTEQIHDAVLPIQLHITVYVTRMKQGYHAIEKLQSFKLVYGQRPQVDIEMDSIKALHEKQRRVWAHVCGSTAFTRTVINEAVRCEFDIHHETFEF